jgi:Cu(I)/Ag(I) efflux system membrane fusion protein
MSRGTLAAFVTVGLVMAGVGYWAGRTRDGATPATGASAPAPAHALYHCPMHPDYTSEKPGTCPICGMDLVPVDAPAAGPGDQAPAMAGRAFVNLTPEKRQLLGVRSEAVKHAPLARTIRTVGRLAVDERRLHHVHTKFDGYVERLYVDFTGKFVEKGDPLLSIYSPDLVATQQEYLLAFRARQELARTGAAAVVRGGEGLLEAARQRLLFWDIEPHDIEALERTGTVMRSLDLHAETSGYVVQKTAFHGMRVTPADTLFDIADLSRLWVLADVYESDLPAVRLGMSAELTLPFVPGRSWRGPVTYVAPTVEEKTRTIKVRIEVENRGNLLKPDMFADVVLKADLGAGLLVPESAVIDAGDRRLVFVDHGEGHLEPREVGLGLRVPGAWQVLNGLADGEKVVTSAGFLLDSESSLKAALAGMRAGSPPPAGHQH